MAGREGNDLIFALVDELESMFGRDMQGFFPQRETMGLHRRHYAHPNAQARASILRPEAMQELDREIPPEDRVYGVPGQQDPSRLPAARDDHPRPSTGSPQHHGGWMGGLGHWFGWGGSDEKHSTPGGGVDSEGQPGVHERRRR